ncbi:MAG: lysophospholipid acyltransferase family protein [Pseudomonadota bacterium]
MSSAGMGEGGGPRGGGGKAPGAAEVAEAARALSQADAAVATADEAVGEGEGEGTRLKRRLRLGLGARDGSDGMTPRDISYSFYGRSRASRAVIRSIENLTGRPRLLRLADGYDRDVAAGRNFWEVMRERYRITLDVGGNGVAGIPSDGPLIVVANHPYGILDGLALGQLLSVSRPHFKIIAHVVFRRADDLKDVILPIDFGETKAAQRVNIETRKQALGYLATGGAIGIFPGGTVSTAAKPFGRASDPTWKTFTAKMIAKSNATVVPIYFEGANSRVFQIASHLAATLRTALLLNEFDSRVDSAVRLVVGDPIPRVEIEKRQRDARGLMEHLRQRTYALGPKELAEAPPGLYLG